MRRCSHRNGSIITSLGHDVKDKQNYNCFFISLLCIYWYFSVWMGVGSCRACSICVLVLCQYLRHMNLLRFTINSDGKMLIKIDKILMTFGISARMYACDEENQIILSLKMMISGLCRPKKCYVVPRTWI